MKLKLLLFILLLPFVSFGASTNKVDNLWVPTSARFSFGTPAVGEVLTAVDSAGFSTWSSVAGLGAGDVFTVSNNTFIAGRTNIFNGHVGVSNLFGQGVIQFTNTPSGGITNRFSTIELIELDPINGQVINMFQRSAPFTRRGSIRVGSTGFDLNLPTGQTFAINSAGFDFSSGNVIMNDNLTVIDNVVFGSGLANTVTINSPTITAANGLNFNSGSLILPSNIAGIITNGSSTAITNQFFLPRGSTSNFVWTSIDTVTGEGRWEAKSAGGGGDVFLAGTNVFTTTGAPSLVVTNPGQSVIFGNLIISGSIISNKNTGAHLIIE